jgi:hypothetical protein
VSFHYLASPYSAHPDGMEHAYRDACAAAALLIRAGVPVFSPIAHSHGIAEIGGIDPASHAIWLPADAPMMRAAMGLIVLQLPGWDMSIGVAAEIAEFRLAGKPVRYMTPGVVPALD